MDYKQLKLWSQLWTNRKKIAVAKPFGTTWNSEAETFAQCLLGQKFLPKCIIIIIIITIIIIIIISFFVLFCLITFG